MEQKEQKTGATPTTPIIVIVGQTASGKSALAMQLAKKYNGEIICADSRTIYRGMDIGTAKPSAADQAAVPHHGLDLINPDESFSASAFKDYAEQKVAEIQERGKTPIIVGGTGLYIDGYVYDYSFAEPASASKRAELAALTLEALQARARAEGIDEARVDFRNPRHLARAIERGDATPERRAIRPNVLLLGIAMEQAAIIGRINVRVDTMFDAGLVDEVQKLITEYGSDAPGLLAPGYKAVIRYLDGELSLSETKNEFRRSDKYLAKRQQTWFKRNDDINWIKNRDEAYVLISEFATIET